MTVSRAKSAQVGNPWVKGCFKADLGSLQDLLTSKLVGGKWPPAAGGALGKALDRWVADELYRAGYEANSVWPRPAGPTYLPYALGKGLTGVPAEMRESREVQRFLAEGRKGIGPRPSMIGEFYRKQIDVLVSDWDRGVEVLVSTKSMTSSFAKNINNRWEEFVGEVRNFRGRYPLASLGVLYLADVKVVDDRAAYDRLVDMLRKLRNRNDDRSRFDATGLVVVRRQGGRVISQRDPVPPDLRPDCFFQRLLVSVFASIPVQERTRARSLYDASIPTKDPALGSTSAQTRVAECGCT